MESLVILGGTGDSQENSYRVLPVMNAQGVAALWTAVVWWSSESLTVHGLLEPFGLGSQATSIPETVTLSLPKVSRIRKVLARETPRRGTSLLVLTTKDQLFVSNPSVSDCNDPSFWSQINFTQTEIIDLALSDSELCIASNDMVLVFSLEDVLLNTPTTPLRPRFTQSLSFTKVAAGSNHFLGLTGRGDVFSTGSNLHGQLGTGTGPRAQQNQGNEWFQIEALAGMRMFDVAAGDLHSLFLSESGDVYSTGSNKHGQLGNQCSDHTDSGANLEVWGLPIPVFEVPIAPVGQMGIAAGARHSLAWSQGALFGCGDSRWGQLGELHSTEKTVTTFKSISAPSSPHDSLKRVWAGAWSSLLLFNK